jgi:uncharacterized protein (DUF58 family)
MHLSQRAYVLILLAAVLAIAGIWSSEPGFSALWRVPAGVLLLGLALEGMFIRRAKISADVETAKRAFLGREQPAVFAFHNGSSRTLAVEFSPVTPMGVEPLGSAARKVVVNARATAREAFALLPVRLGPQSWPDLPARLLGPAGLAWWSKSLPPHMRMAVAPDTLRTVRHRPRGNPAGARSRRVIGAGSELHQLRGYMHGDPPARIDWKATARVRKLVTREFSEDQHLDILVAIDAGRFSRVSAGRIDRFGLYANIAARFAQVAVPNDDRIGMLVFADRPLALCAPQRGLAAVTRIRRTLEELTVEPTESDPLSAAIRIRGLLKHRSLVVLLTGIDDGTASDQLVRAVRLLSPPHFVVIAGVHSREIAELANREARDWMDPWVALAAQQHDDRAQAQRALLARLGAPVISTGEEFLERAVLAEYESLRRSRRV